MLGTDTCAFVLRRTSDTLLERIQAVPVQQQVMSVVTYAELLYGVQVSSKRKRIKRPWMFWPATWRSRTGPGRPPDTVRRFALT